MILWDYMILCLLDARAVVIMLLHHAIGGGSAFLVTGNVVAGDGPAFGIAYSFHMHPFPRSTLLEAVMYSRCTPAPQPTR